MILLYGTQPSQDVPELLAGYSTLDLTRNPLAGKGTWCLLPTTPSMLPTITKHFDTAGHCFVI